MKRALLAAKVAGYPTLLVIDAAGKEVWRAVGYQSSKEMLDLFFKNKHGGSPVS